MDIEVKEAYREKYESFIKLTELEDKLNFWTRNFPINYIQYDEGADGDLFEDLRPFVFTPREGEFKRFAVWVLANYHRLSSSKDKFQRLIEPEDMIASFSLELKNKEDKVAYISSKLWEIESSFHPMPLTNGWSKRITGIGYFHTRISADYNSFNAFKEHEIAPDYSKVYPFLNNVLRVENGARLGAFWRYLKKEQAREIEQKDKQVKDISLDQRLLILHYLGALGKIMKANNATKQGIFLERLIEKDGERIRQRFSYINDLFTPSDKDKKRKLKEDLLEVQEMFKELGLQNIVKNIQADLRKLG